MFLASWLDRRSANGREGAPFFFFFQVLTDEAKRRCPSSLEQATHKDDPGQSAGIEIKESSPRFQNFVVEESNEGRKVNLDLLDEVREQAHIKAEALKRGVELKQKSKLSSRSTT